MKTLTFEVTDHGVDHAQCFQGVGTSGTRYTDVTLGVGDSAQKAGDDALEQFYMTIESNDLSIEDGALLAAEIAKLDAEDDAHEDCEGDHEECEMHHYVSIRWKFTAFSDDVETAERQE